MGSREKRMHDRMQAHGPRLEGRGMARNRDGMLYLGVALQVQRETVRKDRHAARQELKRAALD